MTWHVHITEHAYNLLLGLTPDTRSAVFALFRSLEDDPCAVAQPVGIPDGVNYEAVFSHGIVSLIVNKEAGRITPIAITAI
ncbi:hypothetical protein ABZ553_14625 [Streptomyces sparsogenes]|uniref:hypothetical protein n=1 Tax=Streptomyces sparsogenes TaxID=67365 RepID=UPI0033C30DE9